MAAVSFRLLQALILTKDEEPNIERVLSRLNWLEKVVVLDSISTDRTKEIASSFANVSVHSRAFDTHATQWNFGLSLLDSTWVLSLDADYILTDNFVDEIREKLDTEGVAAYLTKFKFMVFGKELTADNTTPRPILFRHSDCMYFDDGHTQRLKIDGETGSFRSKILHDDRKSLTRWLANQSSYSIKECDKLIGESLDKLSFISKLRKQKILAPIFVFFYCLIVKRAIFGGWRGWHYTLQRTIVEMLLALRLIEETKLKDANEQNQP
ncbi:glycosyltransferase family 2 protein [soil metagenome]